MSDTQIVLDPVAPAGTAGESAAFRPLASLDGKVVGFIDNSKPNFSFLADDLGETKNLAAAMPEKVAEMKALLEKLITDGRSTPGATQKNDVEVVRYPRAESPKKQRKK